MTFRRLGHRRLGSGVFLHLDRRYLVPEGGSPVARDVVRHPGGVAVLPIDGDTVWLLSQFRTAVEGEVLEIPAGKLNATDVDIEAAARRELAEEIGATPNKMILLTSMFPSPGYTDEVLHIFAAMGLTFAQRRPEGAEEVHSQVLTCTFEDALRRIDAGEIKDAKTQIALMLWARRRS